MTATALDIQGAYVTLYRHRSAGPEQAPKCRRCGEPMPCRPRITASNVIQSVYTDVWAGR